MDFGGNGATFVTNSDTWITATVPAGSAGTVDITVTTNNGTSTTSGADEFTYLSTGDPTVTGVSPSSGTTAGGASVAITGTNLSSASAVLFGGLPATSYTVNSADEHHGPGAAAAHWRLRHHRHAQRPLGHRERGSLHRDRGVLADRERPRHRL